jgi:hypothetical protein
MMGRRHHLDAVGAVLIGEMGIEAGARVVPVGALISPTATPRLAERKNCPSDEEVVPSPHIAAIGKA